jgi:hypothetical protein
MVSSWRSGVSLWWVVQTVPIFADHYTLFEAAFQYPPGRDDAIFPKNRALVKKTPEDGGILLPMCRPNPVGAVGPLAAPFNGTAIIVWHIS